MRRARALAAGFLLSAARFLLRGERPRDEEEEVDEEGTLPIGHPVMTMSEEAQRMIRDALPVPRPQKKKAAPLPGSLAARVAAARGE